MTSDDAAAVRFPVVSLDQDNFGQVGRPGGRQKGGFTLDLPGRSRCEFFNDKGR